MKRSSRFAKRLKQDVGSVSSWLILAAGLAAAALAGATVLQHTIHELAANVSSEALAVDASDSPAGSADVPAVAGTGDTAGGASGASGASGAGNDVNAGPGSATGVSGANDGDAAASNDDDGASADGGGRGEGSDDGDGRGDGQGDDPTPIDGGDVSANGVDFTLGPYQEPDIQHDNGHLQDQSDLSNPVPEPTREPTQEEIDYYNDELSAVVLGDRLGWLPLDQDWIPFHDPDERFAWDNAVPAYRHFLEGDGADRTFDMNDYLSSDPAGQVVEQSLLGDASTATDFALSEFATNGELPVGEPVSFTLTSDPVTTSETSNFYPYPSTTDWQRTVGGMQVWTTTDVVATRQPDGTVEVSTTTTIHGEDRYNFNWNQQAIDNGEPDWLRGRLELGDLAHQYDQTGSTQRSDDRTVTLP